MDKRTCPRCGYENLERAVYCFDCNASLGGSPTGRGARRRQRRQAGEAPRPSRGQDAAPESPGQRLPILSDVPAPVGASIPLTCLRCGARNTPQARACARCGGALALPADADPADLVALVAALSSIGQVRSNNEDRVGLWARRGVVLALVADGMGGALAGEEASRLTLETIQADFVGEARGSESLPDLPDEEVTDKLRAAIRRANRAVMRRAIEHPEYQGMGTTVTLAFVRGRQAIIAHIGDSRAYLISGEGGWLNQITDDHSFVEALMAAGHITPEQAAVHPMRSVLYRALGQADETDADLYVRALSAGDWLLLCSDGLTRHVSGEESAAIVRASATPDDVTQRLVALANERGGEDNISVVAIRLERVSEIQPGA
jgi:protein phosphatase